VDDRPGSRSLPSRPLLDVTVMVVRRIIETDLFLWGLLLRVSWGQLLRKSGRFCGRSPFLRRPQKRKNEASEASHGVGPRQVQIVYDDDYGRQQ
jgi:hypothetical protein